MVIRKLEATAYVNLLFSYYAYSARQFNVEFKIKTSKVTTLSKLSYDTLHVFVSYIFMAGGCQKDLISEKRNYSRQKWDTGCQVWDAIYYIIAIHFDQGCI